MLETIYDNKDSTSSEGPAPKFSNLINGDNKGTRIGIPKEYRMNGISEYFIHHYEKLSSDLKNIGVKFVDIMWPHTKYAIPFIFVRL